MSWLEVNLARLTILRDIILATDVWILNTSFCKLVVDSFGIIASIFILRFQAWNEVDLIWLNIGCVWANILTSHLGFLNKINHEWLLVRLLVLLFKVAVSWPVHSRVVLVLLVCLDLLRPLLQRPLTLRRELGNLTSTLAWVLVGVNVVNKVLNNLLTGCLTYLLVVRWRLLRVYKFRVVTWLHDNLTLVKLRYSRFWVLLRLGVAWPILDKAWKIYLDHCPAGVWDKIVELLLNHLLLMLGRESTDSSLAAFSCCRLLFNHFQLPKSSIFLSNFVLYSLRILQFLPTDLFSFFVIWCYRFIKNFWIGSW